jgi:hypothetical protein
VELRLILTGFKVPARPVTRSGLGLRAIFEIFARSRNGFDLKGVSQTRWNTFWNTLLR